MVILCNRGLKKKNKLQNEKVNESKNKTGKYTNPIFIQQMTDHQNPKQK